MCFLRRLPPGLLLLFVLAALAPDTAAQARHDNRTQNAAEGPRRAPIGGALKGAIGGAVAGAVGSIAAIRRLRAKPESDDERNLKEQGRPYF